MTDPKPVVTMTESGRLSVDGDIVATVVYDHRGSLYIIPIEDSSLYPGNQMNHRWVRITAWIAAAVAWAALWYFLASWLADAGILRR